MRELFATYKDPNKQPNHIAPYLALIEDKPLYPVIYDANEVVLSLPPIINGEHSKMTENMKNIFIESTGTDLTKLNKTLNTLVAGFSLYCKKQFTVEPVRVVYKEGNDVTVHVTPDFSPRKIVSSMPYVNSVCGFDVGPNDVI